MLEKRFGIAEGHPESREDAEDRIAEEKRRDLEMQSPDGRPPKPVGPWDFYWHNGKWCRKRADGRLMAVDQSGTFVRNRSDRSDMARPPAVPRYMWDGMKTHEKVIAVKEAKEEAKAATPAHATSVADCARDCSRTKPEVKA